MVKEWVENLAALIPCYNRQGGNGTLVYRTGGEIIIDRRTVKWNLYRLARYFCVDLDALRKSCGEYLGMHHGVPLPLTASLVLVPLKVREVLAKNDGCSGYFNSAAVTGYFAGKNRNTTEIILQGGRQINVLFSEHTVRKRLKAAGLARECFQRQRRQDGNGHCGDRCSLQRAALEPLLLVLLQQISKGDEPSA